VDDEQFKVGDVLHLGPDDYRGGVEPLVFRITAVMVGIVGFSDGYWINLLGVDQDDCIRSIFVSA
jgi:hypothetical protein